MSNSEDLPLLTLGPLSLDQEDFLAFRNLLHSVLSTYFKDMKSESSWIQFYVTQLKLRATGFNFRESRISFKTKLENVLDLMELAYLYCKLTNFKEYKLENHEIHRSNHKYFLETFAAVSDEQFFELRQYLKSNVMFGSN